MIYAVSDLHGCYDKYIKLLERLNLQSGDTLYVLGDVVDRGQGGIEIVKDLARRTNIISLRGNHDYDALVCLKCFAMQSYGFEDDSFADKFNFWMYDGGAPTCEAFCKLSEGEKRTVLNYLSAMRNFATVEAGGRKFFLAHTVPEREKTLNYEQCRMSDFTTGSPEYNVRYFDDTTVVTGHTPTGIIDEKHTGRIWRGNGHIAIDCGAVFGNPLGCICLDTLEEIYVL